MARFKETFDVEPYADKSPLDLALAVQRVVLSKGGRCAARQYFHSVAPARTLYEVAVISQLWLNIKNLEKLNKCQ